MNDVKKCERCMECEECGSKVCDNPNCEYELHLDELDLSQYAIVNPNPTSDDYTLIPNEIINLLGEGKIDPCELTILMNLICHSPSERSIQEIQKETGIDPYLIGQSIINLTEKGYMDKYVKKSN